MEQRNEKRNFFKFINLKEIFIRWTYHSSDELQDTFLYGNLHIYSGGGYYLDLSLDQEESETNIQILQNNSWISRGTRLALIEFSIYNINENIFCIVK